MEFVNSYHRYFFFFFLRMIGCLYNFRKYLLTSKSQIRPKMDHCCHIGAGTHCPALTVLPIPRSCSWWVAFHPATPIPQTKRCKYLTILSLLLWQMFNRVQFQYFRPSQLKLTWQCSYRQIIRIPFLLHLQGGSSSHTTFSFRTVTFPDHYNLNPLKFKVHRYLFYVSS